jgi:hypothetical protein
MKAPLFCSLGLAILSVIACRQNREVKVYRLAKEESPAALPSVTQDPHAGVPGMTPGAAMPSGQPGDPQAGLTADQLAAVGRRGLPQVTDEPPAHWKKQAATSMRQASYLIEGEGGSSVDVALIILRGTAGSTLDNVNRWRGQLGQPPIDGATLTQTSRALKTPAGDAVMVEIAGLVDGADPNKDGRMIGVIARRGVDGWFYKMRGNDALTAKEKSNFEAWVLSVKPDSGKEAPAAAVPAPAAPAAPADDRLTWQAPSGWTLAPKTSSMRYATFTITGADGASAEMVVTHFPGDVGGDLDNVNRWRQQVSLPPVDQAGLPGLVSKVTAGSKIFSVIDATGPQSRVVAGWARHGAETWFFKLTGPDPLVGAEKAKFTSFLESVRFTKPE